MAPGPLSPEPEPKLRLEQITTVWSMLGDPAQFIMRYAPAIRRYFSAMIPNRHDAEEGIQEFLLRVIKTGFTHADSERGRFRDYLKTAVRNAALAQLRREAARVRKQEPISRRLVSRGVHVTVEQGWEQEWRQCVLDRAWRALERHESRSGAGLSHLMLRVVVEHPDEDSKTLASRAANLTHEAISAESFRQRISRARRVLARLLVQEVAETLQNPTPEGVEDELVALGLMPYVRHYLPGDWRTVGVLPSAG
jgi:RNA polymerase sigma-70 factor (ECF subfamily)